MRLIADTLVKTYGPKRALDGVSFELGPGIHGLLGPNGAGKSTLMRILTFNEKPTAGGVLYDCPAGVDRVTWYRSRLGYMPQQQALYPSFSAQDFLLYMAALKGIGSSRAVSEVARVLDEVGLADVARQKIGGFSGGMRQRVLLAQAVLGSPEILVLDEPTAGLDPYQRIAVRNLIARLALRSIVLIATHVVPDVDMVADDILLMRSGRLLRRDSPGRLCADLQGRVFEVEAPDGACDERGWVTSAIFRRADGTRVVRVVTAAAGKPPEGVGAAGLVATEVEPNLEDVYLATVGPAAGRG